ncbi:hypothetical protein BaRGS_00003865 [Batillaria attramentaria]|uniref:Uncharacterized protein n=1 Tax=Batillaria attramentaria TaxID=370345 RepID=A0ABD0M0S7_9CAEN
MRKYRYGNPTQHGIFRKYGNFIYFFAAWNLFGFVVWKTMTAQKRKEDKDWDSKSSTDKYLAMTGIKDKIQRVKIQGFTQVQDEPADSDASKGTAEH